MHADQVSRMMRLTHFGRILNGSKDWKDAESKLLVLIVHFSHQARQLA